MKREKRLLSRFTPDSQRGDPKSPRWESKQVSAKGDQTNLRAGTITNSATPCSKWKEQIRMLEEQYQKGVEQFSKMVGADKVKKKKKNPVPLPLP